MDEQKKKFNIPGVTSDGKIKPKDSKQNNLPIPGVSNNSMNASKPSDSKSFAKNLTNNAINSTTENSEAIQTAKRLAETGKKIAQAGKKVALAAKSSLSALVALVVNPITWIVLAVVIALTYSYAVTLVIGKDSDDCGEDVMGGDLNWPGDDAPVEEKAKAIGCWLMATPFADNGGNGMSAEQAGALLGNMIAETSTLNPSLIQEGAGPGPNASNAQMKAFVGGHTGSNKGAVGLFQHRGSRALRMIEIAEENGKQWNDATSQMQHFIEEVTTGPEKGSLSSNGFWKSGESVQYYSHILNRYYFRSCRQHIDTDSTGCAESFSPPIDWRAAGQRTVKTGEDFTKIIKESGCKSGSGGKTSSKGVSGSASASDGATSTSFPGQEGLKAHTLEYAKHIGEKFGIAVIGGYRPYDPYPDHPSGLALDIMIENKATGDAIAEYFIANESAFAPIYMIWQQQYYNFGNGGRSPTGNWKGMEDRGDPTQNHMDHIHILFKETPGDGNWGDVSGGECAVDSSVDSGDWVLPACGSYNSVYGMRFHPIFLEWRLHAGDDIGNSQGTDIRAAKGGVVSVAGPTSGLGNHIVIQHESDNLTTVYGHLMPGGILVKEGQTVKAGEVIGKMGSTGNSTGPHLHFEIHTGLGNPYDSGTTINPKETLEKAGVDTTGAGIC